jgi:hypothetical protein
MEGMGNFKSKDLQQIESLLPAIDAELNKLQSTIDAQAQQIKHLQAQLGNSGTSSGLSLKTALHHTGWRGKLLAHVMLWFSRGAANHKVTRYDSGDPAVISAQLDILKACGVDGVIVTWFGLSSSGIHSAAIEMCRQCEQKNMLFALLLDPWTVRNHPNKEDALAAALSDPATQKMLNSSAYLPEKAVLDFSTGVNFAAIQPRFPNLKFYMRHIHYSWPETHDVLGNLRRDNSHPEMKIPGVCAGFFDGGFVKSTNPPARDWNKSVWNEAESVRIIPHEAGNTYHDQVVLVPKTAPYAAIVTLNDHDEGTDILHLLSMMTGIRVGS